MTRAALLLLAFACAAFRASPAEPAGARAALGEGLARFTDGDYPAAVRSFREAAGLASGEGLDAAHAHYDLGCALYKAGEPAEAAAAFAEAQRAADPALAAKAGHNRGLALSTVAETAEAAGRLEDAVALLELALVSYEGAMRADPGDEDPKFNHELTWRRKARLEQRLKERQSGGAPPPPEAGRTQQRQVSPRPRAASGKEMAPDEARTLLDAMRQQEMSQRTKLRPPRGGSAAVERPW